MSLPAQEGPQAATAQKNTAKEEEPHFSNSYSSSDEAGEDEVRPPPLKNVEIAEKVVEMPLPLARTSGGGAPEKTAVKSMPPPAKKKRQERKESPERTGKEKREAVEVATGEAMKAAEKKATEVAPQPAAVGEASKKASREKAWFVFFRISTKRVQWCEEDSLLSFAACLSTRKQSVFKDR